MISPDDSEESDPEGGAYEIFVYSIPAADSKVVDSAKGSLAVQAAVRATKKIRSDRIVKALRELESVMEFSLSSI
jgi:IS5 family transposase